MLKAEAEARRVATTKSFMVEIDGFGMFERLKKRFKTKFNYLIVRLLVRAVRRLDTSTHQLQNPQ